MVTTRLHIRILTLLLLLILGGMGNGAWAKVTYHILTKPFTVKTWDGTGNYWTSIRVEALQCTSDETTVGLPEQFKSPLVGTFRYWGSASSTYDKLYDSGHNSKIITTKYFIYNCSGGDYDCLSEELTAGASVGSYTDIYVTYDYNSSNNILDINGGTSYNVAITNSGTQKFMCYNRSRNNRVANALGSGLSGEDLASDDFVTPVNDKKQLGWNWSKWGPIGAFMGFKFTGQDPYNITITTSYEGRALHITDAITNVDNTGTVKPYAGSTLMAKVGANSLWFDASNNKHYKIKSGIKESGQWTAAKYEECWNKYYDTEKDAQYDTWNGFYRYESPTMNAFALLTNPKGGYMFVGSKMNQGDGNSSKPTINQPNSSGQYYSYYDNYDNDGGGRSQPYFKLQALNSALPFNFYAIRTYTVHVKPHGENEALTATMKWSDARYDDAIVDHIPDVLRRKYVNYTAYSDADLTIPVTSFKDIQDKDNGNNIYLKYTVSENIPFKLLPADGNYQDAQWYTMRMDGVANPKYIAYEDASNNLIVTDENGDPKGSNTSSQIHQGENSAEAMVAFMGDPYKLKILNRKACETAPAGNRYVGCATASTDDTGLSTNMTGTSDISTWEIVYESTGETGILLRQFNTAGSTPKYIGLGSATNNKPVTYSGTESRIKVEELEKKKYAFHIMRLDGTMAVMATSSEEVGRALKGDYTDIPEIIRSPYLSSATVNFYATQEDAEADNDPSKRISNLPYNPDGLKEGVYANIYVRYSFTSAPASSDYNVRVNNDYIYTSGDDIKSKKDLDTGDAGEGEYQWTFNVSDPYALTIKNVKKGDAGYVNVSFSDKASITWGTTGTLFIAKSGNTPGTYEVMAATGNEIDASKTYYNIGRPAANTVKLYSNSSYLSGNATLRFQLTATTATDVTYHLVDMSGNELLTAKTRQATTDHPAFPPEYYSPLVEKYYYHASLAHAQNYRYNGDIADDGTIGGSEVYVTYDVNNLIDLKAGQLYLLKYEAGEEFYQEDGSDGRSTTKQKAVYPYVNGDGNFFVYGQEQYDIQQEGAASTRTRWAWYVESNVEGAPKGDPYHVMIKSRQTESYPITNSSEYNAYFMTYKPNGYSEVITTLGWPGMNSETATEYMVLGSEGQYQLVTSYEIGGSRYVVNSFEQYWKTWDTIRKKVYGESGAKENDSHPITIPDTTTVQSGTHKGESFREYLKNTIGWHSYEKWAYAKRWNGYNNGYSSTEGTHEKKKGWERVEHWYQTVDMGEGYFDFVKTDINPVLILLDQHGWEIMRKPIPTDPNDPDKDTKFAAIRPYNSPMVKEYAFWATAKKRTGFHQYYLMSDRIGGDDYTSTDLTSLPPYGSKNVHDKKGNLNDQYVTYIVKDEYAQTYNPSTETGKPFLIEQGTGHEYATTNAGGTTLTASAIPHDGDMMAYILNDNIPATEQWYVKPNVNIDIEMGYNNATHTWTDPDENDNKKWKNKNPNAYDHYLYKDSLVAQYISDNTDSLGYFSFSNGFDPYNIQISSVSAATQFMKTNANGATLHEGSLVGSYPTNPGTISMGVNTTLISPKPKWYDSRDLDVTNATFMAVQDAAGNMQLMPRFDHTTRMSEFGELIAPTDDDVEKTYTKLYRPEVYEYLIIDNDGKESLRYKTGGDLTPQTPAHFQSPLATNFTYYATATYDSGTGKYSDITDKIEESLDGATLTNNKVYVRYDYDEESDGVNMLKGNWLTMQLNNMTTQYTTVSSTAGIYSSLANSYSMTAIDVSDIKKQAEKLKETGDYYFKVGSDTYYKVQVTSAYVDEVYATYTTDDATDTEWGNATGDYKKTVTDYDNMYVQAQQLEANGEYFFKIGADKYVKVTVTSPYISATNATCSEPAVEANSSNWDASKPLVVNADAKKWQWKFAHNSKPDPYAIYIYNRDAKGQKLVEGSRFALLSHSAGYYALAKAGVGTYTYSFLNGDEMSTSTPASVAVESGFTPTSGTFDETKSQVKFTDEVEHSYIYKVYTNGGVEAISATQSQENVISNDWKPVLPEAARTPLLNMDQYRYYEQSLAGVVEQSDTLNKSLSHMYGLYDDNIYTHYTAYDANVSTYVVPNVRNATNENPVARGVGSNDAPIGLDGKRRYNIYWHPDNIMKSDGTSITSDDDDVDKDLQYTAPYEWEFEGDDPYAIKIKSVGATGSGTKRYISQNGETTTCKIDETPTPFMLLNRDGYEYGIFAKTGNKDVMLSGYGQALVTDDHNDETTADNPTKFIIFALSTYKVIYRLIIANTCTNKALPAAGQYVDIPYSEKDNEGNWVSGYKPSDNNTMRIFGTTLRDLESRDPSVGYHVDGDKYQLGVSLKTIQEESSGLFQRDCIYCYDAGHVSLGDAFEVPQAFYRPNVNYDYYIEGVYSSDGKTEITAMNNEYKGLKMTNMGEDTGLLGNIVFVNIVYHFMGGLDTNSGSDFVTGVDQNKWYTFETSDATPMLTEYSGVLKTVSGHATHYTNDYLWTPVGDPYGFKMYNRYLYKNLGDNKVMSTSDFTTDRAIEMVADNNTKPYLPANSVYELLANSSTTPGYFRVHPVVNDGETKFYIKNNSSTGAMTLNTTPTEWTFSMNEDLMGPYYQAAGYIGGLNADGKNAYEAALNVEGDLAKLMALQDVVYNHDNDGSDPENPNYIVHYTPGYYRLHSQPGSSAITTPRYMSGYTHKIELTAGTGSTAIPLHFYEVEQYDVNNPTFKDLGTAGTDYTETPATRGDIPLVTVAKDPASIFYFSEGSAAIPTSKISTQGLYVNGYVNGNVKGNKMTDKENATSFTIVDIGAGIVALQNGENFLKYAQTSPKYDLKFDNDNSTVESARWCMQPVQKGATAGNGEMPLKVTTNYGGDEYYYTTFYAPFDVLLTSTNDEAYIVPTGEWPAMTTATKQYVLRPKKIGEYNTQANGCPEGYRGNNQFIPANTPVIIRTKNTSGEVTMALPTTTPSSAVSCVFSGQYLEQMLDQNSSDYVFVFGRAYTHSDAFTYNGGTGIVTPAGLELDKGVGFYINASNDRESSATKTMWTRNNKYVYANKIYYRAAITATSRQQTRGAEFIPVVFDDEEEQPDEGQETGMARGDNRVFDLQGRVVATAEQVKDGTWKNGLKPGIYIVNGRKVMMK